MSAPADILIAPQNAGLARAWRRSPEAILGASLIALLLAAAIFAPWLAPRDPLLQELGARLRPPSAIHLLGTDGLGRDVLSRLLYGARYTLSLVALVGLTMTPVGLTVGIVSGYAGGWIDRVLSAATNVFMAFPRLLLALAFVGLLGPGLLNATVALAFTGWPAYARLARSETLLLQQTDYLAAAEMQNIRGWRVLFGHVLPMCIPSMQIRLALDLASVTLAAAALGFLGLGVPPPTAEWGVMVAEGSRFVFDQWWLAAIPGLAIATASLGFNLLADGLRDLADPRRG
jgi:peptide/nickel transport system permease protein